MSLTVTFHSKVVSRAALERAIGQLGERLQQADGDATIQIHGADSAVFHIDADAPAVYIGGMQLDLSWRQSALIACLFRAGVGEPVTFLDVARATEVNGDWYTNVRTLASRARTKLPPQTILNVKGVGYRLSPTHTYIATGRTA